jgi:unsaturated rhamnogalacturonyl hydrolase
MQKSISLFNNYMKKASLIFFLLVSLLTANAQQPWSQRVAATAMSKGIDTSSTKLTYAHWLILEGIANVWMQTGDKKYFNYVQAQMDRFISPAGIINTDSSNFADKAMLGRLALFLYKVTEKEKYYKVVLQVRNQIKGRFPIQDKIFHDATISEPFNAEYAAALQDDSLLNLIPEQLISAEKRTLLESRKLRYYAEASANIVDVLDKLPEANPRRTELTDLLNQLAVRINNFQYDNTNYYSPCIAVYAFAKAAREGYLPANYLAIAQKEYKQILTEYVGIADKNNAEVIGAFILASVEIERLQNLSAANGKIVLLDSYFNDEHHKDITGKIVSYHYKWDETTNNGFSTFGQVFNNYGFKTQTLYDEPTAQNLSKASVYIIVDPDIPAENPNTKYIEPAHIKAISNWVKAGGLLVVLDNDTGNAEFVHLNQLMAKFGIQFNLDSRNDVQGSQYEMGAIYIPAGNEIFKSAKKVHIKGISTLKVTAPATSALTDKGDVIIAVAKYGKGTVFAVGDPWFYNEYTDGRKLPYDFQNFEAANDLVKWLSEQSPRK